jgi:hypothetical protein
MSQFKQFLLILLVTLALFQTGAAGLQDMFGISIWKVSSQHGWNDAIILLLLAILVALTTK